MPLRPLHDWAVIQQLESQEQTAGGIIIPDTAKEKPAEGVVVAIGPGKYKTEKGKGKGKGKEKKKKFIPTSVRPGQHVMYAKYMATEVELDGTTYVLVREEDILGAIEDVSMPVEKARLREVVVPQPPLKMEGSAPASKKVKKAPARGKKTAQKKSSGTKKTVAKKVSSGAKGKPVTKTKKPVKKTVKTSSAKKASPQKKKAPQKSSQKKVKKKATKKAQVKKKK
jgi:chaperonin GroES